MDEGNNGLLIPIELFKIETKFYFSIGGNTFLNILINGDIIKSIPISLESLLTNALTHW